MINNDANLQITESVDNSENKDNTLQNTNNTFDINETYNSLYSDDDDYFVSDKAFAEIINLLSEINNNNTINLTESQEAFVAQIQNEPNLFNNLNKIIFWNTDVDEKIIAEHKNNIDDFDKYLTFPLKIAITQGKFNIAKKLIANGATIYSELKIILELSIINLLQRNKSNFDTLTNKLSETNKLEISSYLQYLSQTLNGDKVFYKHKYRNIINPPVREFGQHLDTISNFKGIPSYFGLFGSSIVTLTDHLIYMAKNESNKIFDKIALAFGKTQNYCEFYGNMPQQSNFETKLVNNALSAYETNGIAIIFGGWAGNSVSLCIVGKKLIIANAGYGAIINPETQNIIIKIYDIKNIHKIDKTFVQNWSYGLANELSPGTCYGLLSDIIDINNVDNSLEIPLQLFDNGVCINTKSSILAILYLVTNNKENAYQLYADYIHSLHDFTVNKLISHMTDKYVFIEHRNECCILAISYINNYYLETDHHFINRIYKLYNALEYIGLGPQLKNVLYDKAIYAIHQYIRNMAIEESNLKKASGIFNHKKKKEK